MDIKKGLKVKVLIGKDRGKSGEIIEINRKRNLVKIKSINMVKRHTKPSKTNKGGIISKENFLHMSNVVSLENKKKVDKKDDSKTKK